MERILALEVRSEVLGISKKMVPSVGTYPFRLAYHQRLCTGHETGSNDPVCPDRRIFALILQKAVSSTNIRGGHVPCVLTVQMLPQETPRMISMMLTWAEPK